MKLANSFRNELAERIAEYDTEETRERYRLGQFPRSERVRDLDKRYRWDLFYAVHGFDIMPDGIADSHIDTALRRIVAPL